MKWPTVPPLFEVATAVLCVCDMVTDVLVARQFYYEGHMEWFTMAVSSLFTAYAVYSAMASQCLFVDRWGKRGTPIRRVLYALVAAPFAPAFPVVVWLTQRRRMSHYCRILGLYTQPDAAADVKAWGCDGGDSLSRAGREALAANVAERRWLGAFQASLVPHMKANAGFYVETVVEAAPQAVIQLVAVTALGEASGLQLLSMCLSLFSIVTKAYVVCVTYDLRAMAFKAALIAFDVFSLFHVFATVLARATHPSSTGDSPFTRLDLVAAISAPVRVWGVLSLWSDGLSPPPRSAPVATVLFGFFNQGASISDAECDARLTHVLQCVVERMRSARLGREANVFRRFAGLTPQNIAGGRRQSYDGAPCKALAAALIASVVTGDEDLYAWDRTPLDRPLFGPGLGPAARRPLATRSSTATFRSDVQRCALAAWVSCVSCFARAGPLLVRFVRRSRGAGATTTPVSRRRLMALVVLVYATLPLGYPLLQVLSSELPHSSAAYVCSSLTLGCAYAAAIAVVIGLEPHFERFVTFTRAFRRVVDAMGPVDVPRGSGVLEAMVAQYFTVDPPAAVKAAVPVSVMPHDIAEEVSSFLDASDLRTRDLPAATCIALRR